MQCWFSKYMGHNLINTDRLSLLRSELDIEHLDAFVLAAADPHGSRIVAPHWNDVAWLTTGRLAAGLVAVTNSKVAVWTADEEKPLKLCDDSIEIILGNMLPEEWLGHALNDIDGAIVGVDGRVTPMRTAKRMESGLRCRGGINLRMNFNPVDRLWHDRPALPAAPLYPNISGTTIASRISCARNALRDCHCDGMLVTSLTDIAQLIGLDEPVAGCYPSFDAFMVITPDEVTLYINKVQVSALLASSLRSGGVEVCPYEELVEGLADYFAYNILVDPSTCPVLLPPHIPRRTHIEWLPSPLCTQ